MAERSITQKPWGSEEVLVLTDHYCLKRLDIRPGHRTSLQYHERKTETLMVLYGACEVYFPAGGNGLGSVTMLIQGQSVTITPGQVHRTLATTRCVIFEVSTPELDDVVRLEDDYGRIPAKEVPNDGDRGDRPTPGDDPL